MKFKSSNQRKAVMAKLRASNKLHISVNEINKASDEGLIDRNKSIRLLTMSCESFLRNVRPKTKLIVGRRKDFKRSN